MRQSPGYESARPCLAAVVRLSCCLLLCATGVQAHQLTGTDVATLAQLTVDERLVAGTYEVQYGELAAFDQRKRMDQDSDRRLTAAEVQRYVEEMSRQLGTNLALAIDDEVVPVHLEAGQVLPPDSLVAPGQMTLRYKVRSEPSDFTRPRQVRFRDENQMPRLVHSDISVEGMPLVDLDQSQVDPTTGLLKQVRVQAVRVPVEARVLVKPSETVWQSGPAVGSSTGPQAQAPPPTAVVGAERLENMLRTGALSPGLVLFAVLLALFLGGVHALEPGHGKTIVAAYLVGSRGTVAHAAFLGGVVTSTHTFSVIVLGLITLFASQYILPEQIFPWLGFGSGMLIVGVGIWLFVRALTRSSGHGHSHGLSGPHYQVAPAPSHEHEDDRAGERDRDHAHPHPGDQQAPGHRHEHAEDHDDHDHEPAHSHDHDHEEEQDHGHARGPAVGQGHTHVPQGKVSLGSLLALGVSGGLVPCPGALVILLLAVALHRIAFGMMLILAFSLGLAVVLIAIGVLMVKARPVMERFSGEGKWVQRLPLISSVAITAVGLVLGVRSLIDAGIVIIRL